MHLSPFIPSMYPLQPLPSKMTVTPQEQLVFLNYHSHCLLRSNALFPEYFAQYLTANLGDTYFPAIIPLSLVVLF
jgi:hypothetical protein